MTELSALYGAVLRDEDTIIGEGAVLACPKEARIDDARAGRVSAGRPVRIGKGSLLMHGVIAYEGVDIGAGCVVEDRVRIGYDSIIGARTRLIHGAYLCDRVEVGQDCRIAGFVCDGTRIGSRSSVMGQLVHEYTQPHRGWWAVDEAPPVIGEDTVIGFAAVVIGGVRVGPRSYVAAGSVISRDVPPEHIATGTNVLTPTSRWSGTRLQSLIASWTCPH